jgi:type IV fimbrial biogenesis protein FimT
MKRFRRQALRDLKATNGFTLIELMFTLAVAAVIIGIAAPNMRTFILNNRINSTATEFVRSMQNARSEASKRQRNVVICMSANPTATTPTCATSNYVGWIVFEDTNTNWDYDTGETVIESHTFQPTLKILADKGKRNSYASNGFSTVNGATAAQANATAYVVCDSRQNVDSNGGTTGLSVARGIVIAPTGRVRTTRVVNSTTDLNDISDLLGSGKINSSC